jgi:hypothetical protein
MNESTKISNTNRGGGSISRITPLKRVLQILVFLAVPSWGFTIILGAIFLFFPTLFVNRSILVYIWVICLFIGVILFGPCMIIGQILESREKKDKRVEEKE